MELQTVVPSAPILRHAAGLSVAVDAPVVTFGGFNHLIIVESSSVTLRCMVDANPPVHASSIRWLRSGFQQGSYHVLIALAAWLMQTEMDVGCFQGHISVRRNRIATSLGAPAF